MKLDIEGGEYDVIESLLKNNLLKYIDQLYVEFHPNLYEEKLRTKFVALEDKFKKEIPKHGTELILWH